MVALPIVPDAAPPPAATPAPPPAAVAPVPAAPADPEHAALETFRGALHAALAACDETLLAPLLALPVTVQTDQKHKLTAATVKRLAQLCRDEQLGEETPDPGGEIAHDKVELTGSREAAPPSFVEVKWDLVRRKQAWRLRAISLIWYDE